jgi:hypothetical protein
MRQSVYPNSNSKVSVLYTSRDPQKFQKKIQKKSDQGGRLPTPSMCCRPPLTHQEPKVPPTCSKIAQPNAIRSQGSTFCGHALAREKWIGGDQIGIRPEFSGDGAFTLST